MPSIIVRTKEEGMAGYPVVRTLECCMHAHCPCSFASGVGGRGPFARAQAATLLSYDVGFACSDGRFAGSSVSLDLTWHQHQLASASTGSLLLLHPYSGRPSTYPDQQQRIDRCWPGHGQSFNPDLFPVHHRNRTKIHISIFMRIRLTRRTPTARRPTFGACRLAFRTGSSIGRVAIFAKLAMASGLRLSYRCQLAIHFCRQPSQPQLLRTGRSD